MSCCDPEIDALLLAPAAVKLVASVVLVDRDGRILIATRPEDKPMAGLWEFPGGKVEAHETPEAAVVRELREELAVKTCAGCLLPLTFVSHAYDNFHLLMPVFICRQWENTPIAQEGQQLKWITPTQLNQYEMPKANMLLKAAIRDGV
jgi:8-oxo-dGTP diphosphatase